MLIFIKWIKYSGVNIESSYCAPSILITLINMFLMKSPEKGAPCYMTDPIFPGQFLIQKFLLLAVVICIPWMLAIKPYILKKQNDLRQRFHPANQIDGDVSGDAVVTIESGHGGGHGHGGEFNLGDVIIHQVIHTIEYCLGSISHTASYLRLWALSLAHAQLSEVLWSMVMKIGLASGGISGGFIMFVIFSFWACLTIGILLIMEGLSAFLHALRLHW